MKIFLIAFIALWTQVAEAKIGLKVSLLYRKGIGQGFFLSTEYHSNESVYENESVTVRMSNGVSAKISAQFVQSVHDYGPSAFVRLRGEMFDPAGKVVKSFMEPPIDVYLGQIKSIVHANGDEEQIEVLITPESI